MLEYRPYSVLSPQSSVLEASDGKRTAPQQSVRQWDAGDPVRRLDDNQYGAAAPEHARVIAVGPRSRGRDSDALRAGDRLPAHWLREDLRGQDLPARRGPDRPDGLSR